MNTSYAHHRLILSCLYSPSTGVKSCSLYSILNEQSDTAVDLDCPLNIPRSRIMVVGCCDGLVCIAAGKEVCIWNPSTRKSKRLPNVDMGYLFYRYGFCYDESIDDYKVVGFFSTAGPSDGDVEVKVYTSKTDSWRSIVDSSDFMPWNDSGIYVKGALHWAPWGESHKVIVSLDLAKEKFGEVLQPDYGDGHSQSMLAVVSGCLCVVRNYDGARVDVWVMKEYGRRESWIKLVVMVPYNSHPSNFGYSLPLCILKIGEVLVLYLKHCVQSLNTILRQMHLVRYNPKDVTFTYPTLHNCPLYFVAYPYIESLVLLDTLGFDCNTTSKRSKGRIVGCCDGLVCGTIYGGVSILNPSTRRSKRLPDVEMPSPFHSIVMYGFGYDESIDDYKVAVFSRDGNNSGFYFEAKGEVYSLRTNSWRRIGGFTCGLESLVMHVSGTYLNGALHWISCSLYSILNEQSDTAVDLDFPSKVSNHRGTIVGCCDGLVCVASDREVFIWNPSTRKSKRLPDVEIPSPYHYIAMHGFGYDESIDDYKVAVFSCDANNQNRGFEAEGKLYSLRTNSWRRIRGFPSCLHMDVSGTYLNGALHWIVRRIVGCCDGLVCGTIYGGVSIWNPSTRRSKRLPDVEMPSPYHYIVMYGFGYDESIDDYKVAVFSRDCNNSGFYFEAKGEVYSLRTNSWRRIGGFTCGLHMDISGTYLNGALHWTSCSLYSILNEQSDTAVDLDFPSKVSNHRGTIVGCCDGLVCVASDREVFIWNPSTRKSKRLPDVEIPSPYHYIAMHGFGYDESIDDYKVAVFSCDANNQNRGFEAEGNVYSLRTNSWRRIRGFPSCLHMDVSGTYLNGALHWISCSLHSILNEKSDTAVELDFPWNDHRWGTWIVGCCYGLVCVRAGQEVVGVFSHVHTLEIEVKVYTLRTNSWRRIGDFPHLLGFGEEGTYLNGALHWTWAGVAGFSSINNTKGNEAVDLDCPLKASNSRPVSILGCCDGLVCVATDRELSIWNPSTRKSKRLPKMPNPSITSYGFGYDESTDDYKTPSWRRIEGSPHRLPSDGLGTYLNGARHWTGRSDSNVGSIIVSVDLVKEAHGEVLEPDYGDGHVYRSSLDVLNGCLCILHAYRYYTDVWVMKEYGTSESWTKLVVIPYVKHPSGSPYATTPVCILKNGEVLLHNFMHWVRYNSKDGTFVYPTIHNCSARFNVFPYVESLVSPDIASDGGVHWQH
ncbi:hypothetical protein RHGRI_003793 [Rhododendron griersonianum]|uniref:F-box/kelch-repeat protein n=1 Tax=Rhododendron griersonianum TaxID=479676 RepID=A0AAV6L6J8_9ERIC|nr:hypothetical protein RHGRI_003793 [Rhododendron griersonianum]